MQFGQLGWIPNTIEIYTFTLVNPGFKELRSYIASTHITGIQRDDVREYLDYVLFAEFEVFAAGGRSELLKYYLM